MSYTYSLISKNQKNENDSLFAYFSLKNLQEDYKEDYVSLEKSRVWKLNQSPYFIFKTHCSFFMQEYVDTTDKRYGHFLADKDIWFEFYKHFLTTSKISNISCRFTDVDIEYLWNLIEKIFHKQHSEEELNTALVLFKEILDTQELGGITVTLSEQTEKGNIDLEVTPYLTVKPSPFYDTPDNSLEHISKEVLEKITFEYLDIIYSFFQLGTTAEKTVVDVESIRTQYAQLKRTKEVLDLLFKQHKVDVTEFGFSQEEWDFIKEELYLFAKQSQEED